MDLKEEIIKLISSKQEGDYWDFKKNTLNKQYIIARQYVLWFSPRPPFHFRARAR